MCSNINESNLAAAEERVIGQNYDLLHNGIIIVPGQWPDLIQGLQGNILICQRLWPRTRHETFTRYVTAVQGACLLDADCAEERA